MKNFEQINPVAMWSSVDIACQKESQETVVSQQTVPMW